MSEFKIARTRSDWVRFTAIMLTAALSLGNAARFAGQNSWISMALTLAGGLCLVTVAFATISTNRRVRRWVTWGRTHDTLCVNLRAEIRLLRRR
ncbi:hypothetical protein BJP78_26915 (plasmid) [Mycobacterium avium subsp. hominissuis]|uniref:hypothetical protein n=1 Tax=Mycobacterium avium TaxID=1764 RepID=UPI001C406BED|nr:hypothetical protein [Mycobacterium avium]QWY65312.1 hypothetical protein BJP78_26915 [Mycobacterium avium subsp. hominissuis]